MRISLSDMKTRAPRTCESRFLYEAVSYATSQHQQKAPVSGIIVLTYLGEELVPRDSLRRVYASWHQGFGSVNHNRSTLTADVV